MTPKSVRYVTFENDHETSELVENLEKN